MSQLSDRTIKNNFTTALKRLTMVYDYNKDEIKNNHKKFYNIGQSI